MTNLQTVKQLTEQTNIPKSTVYLYIRKYKIKHSRLGNKYLIDKDTFLKAVLFENEGGGNEGK